LYLAKTIFTVSYSIGITSIVTMLKRGIQNPKCNLYIPEIYIHSRHLFIECVPSARVVACNRPPWWKSFNHCIDSWMIFRSHGSGMIHHGHPGSPGALMWWQIVTW
jgi:hypothetical protein